jgi:Sec-independent protein secretion pathway component TatC
MTKPEIISIENVDSQRRILVLAAFVVGFVIAGALIVSFVRIEDDE